MDISMIEAAAMKSWPALEETRLPFGVLRYAHGVSRRANSMNLFPDARCEASELRASTEEFFRPKNLPAVVRISATGSQARSLDSYLGANGYHLEAPTKVLLCDLSRLGKAAASLPQSAELEYWLSCWHQYAGHGADQFPVHLEMLRKLRSPHRFSVFADQSGAPVSTAMGVVTDSSLGIYAVATSSLARGQGYALKLLLELLAWGVSEGAQFAYLQVEATNVAAQRLYAKLGFIEIYDYWYRVKSLQ